MSDQIQNVASEPQNETDAKNEMSPLWLMGDEPLKGTSTATTVEIDAQYASIRAMFADGNGNLWDIGDAINKLKTLYSKANKGQPLHRDDIAERLGLEVTGARIGALADTAEAFPKEENVRDTRIAFRVYEEARKANDVLAKRSKALTPKELFEKVQQAQISTKVREAILGAESKPRIERFYVSVEKITPIDGSKSEQREHLRFNGNASSKENENVSAEDRETFRRLSLRGCVISLLQSLELAALNIDAEATRETEAKYGVEKLDPPFLASLSEEQQMEAAAFQASILPELINQMGEMLSEELADEAWQNLQGESVIGKLLNFLLVPKRSGAPAPKRKREPKLEKPMLWRYRGCMIAPDIDVESGGRTIYSISRLSSSFKKRCNEPMPKFHSVGEVADFIDKILAKKLPKAEKPAAADDSAVPPENQ